MRKLILFCPLLLTGCVATSDHAPVFALIAVLLIAAGLALRSSSILALLALPMLIAGCAQAPAVEPNVPKVVEVPVPVKCPSIVVPPRPELPIDTLTDDSQPDDTAKAYAETVEVLKGYAKALEQLLSGYNGQAQQ